jgi:hypothetical protein
LQPGPPEELDEEPEPELDELDPVGHFPSLFARAVQLASSMHLRSASVADWHAD